MSASVKVSLWALISSAAAIPHYGHSKFHSLRPSGAHGTGYGKPYPSGGWEGSHNRTRIAHPTGTGYYGDKTVDVTSTSTTTVISTVIVKPSPVSQNYVAAENVSQPPANGQCGPATVTVTASEKVTVTVTPGYGAGIPSQGEQTTTSTVTSTTKVEQVQTTKVPAPAAPQSSKVDEYRYSPVKPSAVYTPAESAAYTPVAPSSAAPSSAAPQPSSGSGNGYSGAKRGLAYNDAALCKDLGSKFGFGYNWGQVENNDIGTKFVPMMHGPDKSTSQEWLANVDKAKSKGSTAVMGFNEPDLAAQANLTPEAACSAWKEYMNPVAEKGLTILGPSVTNGPAPMGLDWLSRFHTACPDAVVDATNIHFYDIYDNGTVDRFKAQVEKAASLFGKPVWVTEFGLNPGSASQEQAASFLKDCMAYMDSSDKVQGYSYFMVGSGENQLNTASGALSTVGQVYAGSS